MRGRVATSLNGLSQLTWDPINRVKSASVGPINRVKSANVGEY